MKKSWTLFLLLVLAMNAYSASANKQYQKGKKAFDKGEYSEAISYFKKGTETDPQNGDFFRWLGNAYYRNVQYQDAVGAYKQALSLPHNKDVEYESWSGLSEAQGSLGQLDSAISSRKKYIELKPDDPNGFSWLAKLYIDNKQYDEAITAAKRAIELKADSDYAYYALGVAYRTKKQYNEAFNAIKKAIEINPADAVYHCEMLNLFYVKEDYTEAIEVIKKIVELQPNNINYLYFMENTYMLMGKYDDAIAAVNKAIALQTFSGIGVRMADESGYPVVKEVMETGPAKKARIEVGDKIIKINGKSTEGWNNEKTNQTLRGTSGTQVVLTIEREGARKSIDKTVTRETIFPKDAAASFGMRSIAYRHKGSLEAALQDAEKAYSLNPAYNWVYYSQGVAYLDQGHYDESIKLLSQVKNLPGARILEATAYAKQGKMKEAENIYYSIPEEELSPKNISLMDDRMALLQLFKPLVGEHRGKARSLEAQGQYQEALIELSEALKTADETEAQALQESIFSMVRMNPFLSGLPEEARECVLRGEMLVKEANFEQAAAEYKKAIRIAPYAVRLYYNSALIYKELKKYPEAIRQMNMYLQAVPDAPDARAAKDEIIKWKFMMEKER
ncbi:MAG: tetratricopeptide repeat protein [Candidatus Aminicenantes bacterium]|nr:tetratricopeptide repeat protein [Candidatus Aminicenantes bacterium]